MAAAYVVDWCQLHGKDQFLASGLSLSARPARTPAFIAGRDGEGVGLRHGVFDATGGPTTDYLRRRWRRRSAGLPSMSTGCAPGTASHWVPRGPEALRGPPMGPDGVRGRAQVRARRLPKRVPSGCRASSAGRAGISLPVWVCTRQIVAHHKRRRDGIISD